MDYGHWSVSIVGDFDPNDWFGFVYLITNTSTDRKYVGRKQFHSKNRKKVAGRSKRRVVIKDSDWRSYTGSSDILNADIDLLGKSIFTFQIIILCKTKGNLGYSEVSEQFNRDVLYSTLPDGNRAYYNNNIMSRWFNADNVGRIRSCKTRELMGKAKRGVPKSEAHREKIRAARLGSKKSEASKEKVRLANQQLKWYNNGTISKRSAIPLDLPWIEGRILPKSYKKKVKYATISSTKT